MAEPFAVLQDVTDIWEEPLTTWQQGMVVSRLREASNKIRNDVARINGKTVDERVVDNPLFADVVRDICRNMVHRLLLNPRARSDIAIDDSKVTLNASIASGQMYITDDEMRSLSTGLGSGVGDSAAFTVRAAATPFVSSGRPWPRRSWYESWPTWF